MKVPPISATEQAHNEEFLRKQAIFTAILVVVLTEMNQVSQEAWGAQTDMRKELAEEGNAQHRARELRQKQWESERKHSAYRNAQQK